MRFLLVLLLVSGALQHVVLADDSLRASKLLGKGAELYSWRDAADGQWRFSVLPGTNRNKTFEEIKAPEQILKTLEALKQKLDHFAVGEYVVWLNPDRQQFTYPPKAIRDEIAQAAEASGLRFQVFEPR